MKNRNLPASGSTSLLSLLSFMGIMAFLMSVTAHFVQERNHGIDRIFEVEKKLQRLHQNSQSVRGCYSIEFDRGDPDRQISSYQRSSFHQFFYDFGGSGSSTCEKVEARSRRNPFGRTTPLPH